MSCAWSKENIALHVEGDLPAPAAETVSRHLAACDDCRRFFDQLRARQSLLKSLRGDRVSPAECIGMRREVMSIINERQDKAGWALRMERAITLGVRQHSYALVAFALLGIVSVSVMAQMRHAPPDSTESVAVFEGKDTLFRPERYREWIVVGQGPLASVEGVRVYIDPASYRAYARTGKFSEGTLMVWESPGRAPGTTDSPHRQSSRLLASVKDGRFAGGWGFFDFTGLEGEVARRAQALPESSGCRACHRHDAETDHVFTQFYPVLQSARHRTQLGAARGGAAAQT